MLVAIIILTLYFWAYFADVKSIAAALLVSDTAAIAAGSALLLGFISYLWAPQKYIFWGAYSAYMLLAVTTAILIVSTDGASSPFIALWMVVSIFAGVFGLYGMLPLLVAIALYTALQFTDNTPEQSTIVAVILGGVLPLIISYITWHSKTASDGGGDRAYRELATELSQVAGKSEVVINAIADGVIALDNKGIIQLINPAAQQIIGWGKQDALSLDYKSVLKLTTRDDKDVTTANDPVLKVLADNKEVTTDELVLLTSTGKKRQVAIVVSPIGQLGSGVIIVFRDITKEKAEEREQAEFISTASHEMRTPVASIEGYLGLALNPNTAQIDDKARDFINKAHESAEHLGRLFQDLLDVAKAEDGRMSNNPKVVDVVEFTDEVVESLRLKAESKGLRMLFKPRPDGEKTEGGERQISPVFYANVDNGHLREILSNLIDNAIKYTPSGDVTIDITGDSDHVIISVADSGIGIPKEDQVHLFQKFYRIDNSETREIGGTGLGLYLSRRLAEAMSGRIWVESEFKRGSIFYLEIPRIDHEEAMRLIEAAAIKKEEEISNVTINPAPIQSPEGIEVPTLAEQPPPSPTPITPAPPIQPEPQVALSPQQPLAPAPVTQTYQPPQAPTTLTPPQYTRPITNHPNTPLASIEQNPNQYIQQTRGGVSVPPRR
jgi:PAS domain S-box-containing protein